MDSLNGYALTDSARGWILLGATAMTADTEFERTELVTPGIDGSAATPSRIVTPARAFKVGTTAAGRDSLRSLLLQSNLVNTSTGRLGNADVQVASIGQERVGMGVDAEYEVSFTLTYPGVWYRGSESTESWAVTTATKTLSVFAGISGKITDSLIRLSDCTDPRVADSAGSFFGYTGVIAAGSFLRFDSRTGRAWMTATDSWTGGVEVDSALIVLGPRPHFLAITPEFTLDPGMRRGKLTVTTSSFGPTAEAAVRGRNAYLV